MSYYLTSPTQSLYLRCGKCLGCTPGLPEDSAIPREKSIPVVYFYRTHGKSGTLRVSVRLLILNIKFNGNYTYNEHLDSRLAKLNFSLSYINFFGEKSGETETARSVADKICFHWVLYNSQNKKTKYKLRNIEIFPPIRSHVT